MDVNVEKFRSLKQSLKELFISAMISCKHSYEELFSEQGDKRPEIILPLLNDAASTINTMRSIYIVFDDLAHQEYDEFFRLFDEFKEEVFENFRTNHSHQWSLIQYHRMIDWAMELGSLLGVDDPSFLKAKVD